MRLLYPIILAIILILTSVGFFIIRSNLYEHKKIGLEVAGTSSLIVLPTLTVTAIPTLTITPSLTPTPTISLKKESYSIAIFGDSMIDTMGEKLEYLQKKLAGKYPQTEFVLYNYGIGGQNIEQGLNRFESTFVNRERNFPPIPALIPDVLIIGTFSYNPFSTHDRNRHYALLKELITRAGTASSHVYLLAEIAPLKTGFGKGKNGVNMPEDIAYQHALNIIEQLDNAVNLSMSENVPLINAYYESRANGSFGNSYYVNSDDGIHPSVAGHLLTADLIVKNINLD